MRREDWIAMLFTLICCGIALFLGYMWNVNKQPETVVVTDTITITDTITDWHTTNITHYRTDTLYLPIIDTITDSILVEVPINRYHYDTVIADTNYQTDLNIVISGFNACIETLTLHTDILSTHTEIMPQTGRKWYKNIVPAVGIGIGTGGFGVFAGIGYEL